jgi:hypothetical protein
VPVDWEQLTCDMKYHKMKASAQKVDSRILFIQPLFVASLDVSIVFRGREIRNLPTQKEKKPSETSDEDKETKERVKKKHFIINILFKLRCYCCQNCNFHNEFQVFF